MTTPPPFKIPRSVLVVIHTPDLQVLLIQRADAHTWHLENLYDIYPHYRHRYAPGVTRNAEQVFGLCVPQVLPIRLSPSEHIAHQWLDWQAAADTVSSGSNAEAILQLPQRLRERA